jgi:hypothetical protein
MSSEPGQHLGLSHPVTEEGFRIQADQGLPSFFQSESGERVGASVRASLEENGSVFREAGSLIGSGSSPSPPCGGRNGFGHKTSQSQ